MKNLNLVTLLFVSILLVNCGKKNDNSEVFFSIDNQTLKPVYSAQEKVEISVLNPSEKAIDSVVYYLNDKRIGAEKSNKTYSYLLSDQKLGYQNIKALVYFEDENQENITQIEQPELIHATFAYA